jgi:hypothetical protein
VSSVFRSGPIDNLFVQLYPQSFLTLCLVLDGDGFWFDQEVAFAREELPTMVGIEMSSPYWLTDSRIQQILGRQRVIEWITQRFSATLSRRDIQYLNSSTINSVFPLIMHSFSAADKSFPNLFLKSHRANMRRWPYKMLLAIIRKLRGKLKLKPSCNIGS